MSSKDYRKIARVKLGSNIFTDTWTKLGIICVIVTAITTLFSIIIGIYLDPRLVSILNMMLSLFLIPMNYSLDRICLNVSRGNENVNMKDVTYFYDVPLAGMFKLELLKYVYLTLWSFIPLASIIKYYSYSMANFIKLDNENISAGECITRSRVMMNGHKFELFLLEFSFIGWSFVAFTFGMGIGYVMSYLKMARVVFYNKISRYDDVNYINDNIEFYNGKEIINNEKVFKRARVLDIFIIIIVSLILAVTMSYYAYTMVLRINENQQTTSTYILGEDNIKTE